MVQLDKTNVHNLAEERSVGSANNELKVRGKCNLEYVSRKLVLNKSFDLIEKQSPKDYQKFRKAAKAITALKDEWSEMKGMEEEAFTANESMNLHVNLIRYRDLDFLKGVGGPFTKAYIEEEDTKEMNKRLYVEFRYAKKTVH